MGSIDKGHKLEQFRSLGRCRSPEEGCHFLPLLSMSFQRVCLKERIFYQGRQSSLNKRAHDPQFIRQRDQVVSTCHLPKTFQRVGKTRAVLTVASAAQRIKSERLRPRGGTNFHLNGSFIHHSFNRSDRVKDNNHYNKHQDPRPFITLI